jgi:hypothetical protein
MDIDGAGQHQHPRRIDDLDRPALDQARKVILDRLDRTCPDRDVRPA